MNVREKLVELLKTNACPSPFMCDPACRYYGFEDCFPERFADYLIANGVTVQGWISVEDRLPDACGFPCLLCGKNSFGQIRVFEGFTGYMERGKFEWHSNRKDIDIDVWTITHWMPLPLPPKGE